MKAETANELALALRQLREGLGMSIEEAAKESELSDVVIRQYEEAKREFAYPHELFFLSQTYFYPYMKLIAIAGHLVPKEHPCAS